MNFLITKAFKNILSNGFGVYELKRLRLKNGSSHFNSFFLFLSILSVLTILESEKYQRNFSCLIFLTHFCKSNPSFLDVNLAKWQ